jgi:hypothetical protein
MSFAAKTFCKRERSTSMKTKNICHVAGAVALGIILMATLPVSAQTTVNDTAANATGAVGNTANTVGQTATGVANQLPGTVSSVGSTLGSTVGGLQPTLQPIGQGVGSALNNLTQPDNVSALLEFLSSIVPNHIEAHVNLDALRVEKVTVDVRGVDLRNLKVDLLVANSRNAGVVRPALQTNGTSTNSGSSVSGTGLNGTGLNGTTSSNGLTAGGTTNLQYSYPPSETSSQTTTR